MPEVAVLSAVRTAVGTARKGSLANTLPEKLASTVLQAAMERSGVAPELVEDVIMGESLYGGGDIARYAAEDIGIVGAGGAALNRHCASGLTAVGVAAGSIAAGMERFVIGGGVHSSSFMPQMLQRKPGSAEFNPWMPLSHRDRPQAPALDMSISVGWTTAQEAGLSREELDAWALRSHQRAIAAIDAGNFEDEIVPVEALGFDGTTSEFKVDEHPRRGTSMEKLAELKVLHPEIEGFNITAGNSSGLNDAAGALMLADMERAKGNGSEIIAKVLGWTSKGVDPSRMGMGAIEVIEKLLERTGRKTADIKLWEINEAFASVPVAACKILKLDEETVNISGSGCSIGHPIAASGARMLATLINDLKRAGGGLGVAAMCAGGGQGGAVLIEV